MNNFEEIVKGLKEGKIGIFPTDTAYGIGCRMDNASAVERVFAIRKRPLEKAVLVLVSSVEMAEQYVNIPPEVRAKLVDAHWPGGLTIILNCDTDKVPAIVRSEGTTLAIRLPDHPALVKIIESLGVPLIAPSANFSTEKTPLSFEEVDENLKSQVDFVMTGVCTIKGVSTIVDATVNPWKIVRQGVVNV